MLEVRENPVVNKLDSLLSGYVKEHSDILIYKKTITKHKPGRQMIINGQSFTEPDQDVNIDIEVHYLGGGSDNDKPLHTVLFYHKKDEEILFEHGGVFYEDDMSELDYIVSKVC